MPNGVAHDIYVIATKPADGSLPNETKVYDDRVFFTREDAVEALDDFQPYMRDQFEVYAAHLHIAGVSHDTPFVMPTDDVADSDEDTDEDSPTATTTSGPTALERATMYNACRQAIVDWCLNNRSALDAEFTNPISNSEFADACDPANWMTWSEKDSDIDPSHDFDAVYKGYGFDCDPFDDQLRAYVSVDDQGNVTNVVVQGE